MATKNIWEVHGKEGGTAKYEDVSGTMRLTLNGTVDNQGAIEVITGADTIVAADNNKVFYLDAAAGATVTLPTLAAGLRFRFMVSSAFATSNWVVASAEGDNISGTIIVNGASVAAAAEDQLNFVNSAESIGDYIDIIADSTNSQWIVTGVGQLAGSITATDPA